MNGKIHPTAIIDPKAKVDPTAEIGPCAVIDAGVVLGPGCRVGPHVYLTGETTIGANNQFHAGAVIGDAPQDLKYKNEPARVTIGEHNVFREGVTVHRSAVPGQATIVGSHNFLMANSHIGHNTILGSHCIIANGALLGGHVEVADRVFISGNAVVHQFTRIGTLAIMQGLAGIGQDLPPYTIATGVNVICGLNVIGLRRAGYTAAQRLEIKRLYHALFRSGKNLSVAVAEARGSFASVEAVLMLDFIAGSKRGVCRDISNSAEADID